MKVIVKDKQLLNPIPLIQNKQYKNHFSIFKILCPCLFKHNHHSQSQINKYQQKQKYYKSFKRQNYLEQKTQNIQNFFNQQTEENLPQNEQFTQDKMKIQYIQNDKVIKYKQLQQNLNQKLTYQQLIEKNSLNYYKENKQNVKQDNDKNKKTKIVTFDVKMPNKFQGYLKQNNKNFRIQQKRKSNHNQVIRSQLVYSKTNYNTSQKDLHKKIIKNNNKSQNQQNQLNFSKSYSKKSKILQQYNINLQQIISIQKHLLKMQGYHDYQFLNDWQQTYQNHYPISKIKQNKLIVLGNKNAKLLVKVKTVKLYPSASALQKYKQSIKNQNKSQKISKNNVNNNNKKEYQKNPLDRYWDKRYFLFQKFDQGIKLDEQSWYSVTPQAVADYVSTKITVQNSILDAFCGAGGDTVKLATSCKQIIANDIDQMKIKCLINNANVYDVKNIKISCMDYFNIDFQVDAVYLAPPWGGPDYHKIQSFHPNQFEPSLSLIIQKAFTLSNNIFFLLPANTDIQALSALICQKAKFSKNSILHSCSLKLQKIFYNQRLKFIAGYFGTHEFQNDVKITEELSYFYQILKDQNMDNTIFKHKKLIRKLRQQHGMLKLLNWLFECQLYGQNIIIPTKNNIQNWNNTSSSLSMIQKFQAFIIANRIITQKQLIKIKQEQQRQYEYQLKNRNQRNKRNKNKKIHKIINRQKERQNKQIRYSDQNHMKISQMQKIYQFHKQQQEQNNINQKQYKEINSNKNKLKQTKLSFNQSGTTLNINSQIIRSESSYVMNTLRTVSIVSQFHQDQLQHMMHQRNSINNSQSSTVSILDPIHPITKMDSLDISFQQSYQLFSDIIHSNQKSQRIHPTTKNQQLNSDSPPSFNQISLHMKKNKKSHQWQKGIISKINQQKQAEK